MARRPTRGPRAGGRRPRLHVSRAVGRPDAARPSQPVATPPAAAHPPTPPPRPATPEATDLPDRGNHAVQVLRTYPAKRPPYPFAPDGERSIARAYIKALRRARRLIYVEDQYLWSAQAARVGGRARARARTARRRRRTALSRSGRPVVGRGEPHRSGEVHRDPAPRRRRSRRGVRPRERRGAPRSTSTRRSASSTTSSWSSAPTTSTGARGPTTRRSRAR